MSNDYEDGMRYLRNLLVTVAPQVEPFDTLTGMLTQVNNYIAGLLQDKVCQSCGGEGQVQLADEGGNRMWWPCPTCRDSETELERLRRQTDACRRYFDHCRRVSLAARHAGCNSGEMAVRRTLKEEAEKALGM